ncbi:hypothetical protein JCM19236_5657 [Vibrio sp. JCM 19236]|nr:hypothetical protein JCM19236_5657 [Vibrio sp. JCM 19236]
MLKNLTLVLALMAGTVSAQPMTGDEYADIMTRTYICNHSFDNYGNKAEYDWASELFLNLGYQAEEQNTPSQIRWLKSEVAKRIYEFNETMTDEAKYKEFHKKCLEWARRSMDK